MTGSESMPVMPAKACIQFVHLIDFIEHQGHAWIPAFAGMTGFGMVRNIFTATEPAPRLFDATSMPLPRTVW